MLFLQLDWASLNSNFSLTTIWAQITSVPAPGPAPPLKGRQDLQKTFAMGMARRRRKKLTLGIGMVVTTIAACLALKLSADMSFWITLTAVCIAFIIGKVTSKPVRRDAKIKDAAAQYQGIQEKWKQEASDAAFTAKLNEFDAARKELEAFPRRRREGLQELEKNRKQIQLQKWLDRHYIRDANLAGIGAGRKALLASYGIDTAGDLSWPSLQPVNGIGPRNAATLMTWRDSVATQFVFNPGQGIGQLEIARLDRELADRRAGLEQKLTGGAGELQIIRQRIFDARASLQADAERALELLMQAEAHGKRIGFR
jgi:DNA-binding helix-hairpin-helix protein with protein kinase domain